MYICIQNREEIQYTGQKRNTSWNSFRWCIYIYQKARHNTEIIWYRTYSSFPFTPWYDGTVQSATDLSYEPETISLESLLKAMDIMQSLCASFMRWMSCLLWVSQIAIDLSLEPDTINSKPLLTATDIYIASVCIFETMDEFFTLYTPNGNSFIMWSRDNMLRIPTHSYWSYGVSMCIFEAIDKKFGLYIPNRDCLVNWSWDNKFWVTTHSHWCNNMRMCIFEAMNELLELHIPNCNWVICMNLTQ